MQAASESCYSILNYTSVGLLHIQAYACANSTVVTSLQWWSIRLNAGGGTFVRSRRELGKVRSFERFLRKWGGRGIRKEKWAWRKES